MDYCILLKKFPRSKARFGSLCCEFQGMRRLKEPELSRGCKLLGYALSAVSTYKAT